MAAKDSKYISLAFSDHLGMVVSFTLPNSMAKMISPRSHPFFKTSPEVVSDPFFQEMLKTKMKE